MNAQFTAIDINWGRGEGLEIIEKKTNSKKYVTHYDGRSDNFQWKISHKKTRKAPIKKSANDYNVSVFEITRNS